ncbi:hypothetical protein Ga0123462_2198 [Mariprofundus ferrinatatus]|uniref:Uncharacterized protein n=2 Tax=Mariprofundus ferrinatatus TaxID=1921087 RepID=A0A2K8L7C2_9PROT|nr:hypothetical protein Ga0123462_2198 [Mariprofundus ferrinatatus]
MGIHITLHAGRNFILAIFHGPVTAHELESFVDELLLDKYDTKDKVRLAILSEGASASLLRYHTICAAGKRMRLGRHRQHRGKLAIIARSRVGFGLAKMYQMATEKVEPSEILVLHGDGLESATQWLGISDLSANIRQILNCVEQGVERGLSTQMIR